MFEAIITLCLNLSDGPCRDHLLPGYEAKTVTACADTLSAKPPDLTVFAPLEAHAPPRCAPAGEALEVTEIAPGVFVHTGKVAEPDADNRGDIANLGFIIGDTGVIVIDTGTARWIGEALWRTIRQQTDAPVTHVILTHMHPDHALGASLFVEAGAQIIGHANLPRALADRHANYLESLDRLVGADVMLGTRSVPVDVTIDAELEIEAGGRALQIRAWPMAHTGTDITAFDPQTGTLFAGDLVFHLHTPALDGSLTGWRKAMANLAQMPLQRVVPGHGAPALDWPAGADNMMRYLEVLETDTRTAIDAGQRLGDAVEVIAQSEAEHWQLFEAYNPRNATVAFTELEWE